MSKKTQHNKAYTSVALTFIVERDKTQKLQCFLCGKILVNRSMKSAKQKEHLMSVHPESISNSVKLFSEKEAQFEKAEVLPKLGLAPMQKPQLEASYDAAHQIAKQKKPHTIAETSVKPCVLETAVHICGLEQRKKTEAVPL